MTSCVLEVSSPRKNKISLTDYDYQSDIRNRLLLSRINEEELKVLEEILYSPLQFSLSKLAKNLDLDLKNLLSVLEKLKASGLFFIDNDTITVDKEKRKYFELQLHKFDDHFQPGMDFLQNLLKNPPIHVLPIWYAIPRTSNNIFDSLIEKILHSPVLFRRYIADLNFGEPVLHKIIEDVYTAENFEISAQSLIDKYSLTPELFEEYMLHLEFSFVCCVGYRKKGSQWEEKVTPFYEWREYLLFLRNSELESIPNEAKIEKKRPHDFSFVQDLAIVLKECLNNPNSMQLETTEDGLTLPKKEQLEHLLSLFQALSSEPEVYRFYLDLLIKKLQLTRLATLSKDLYLTASEIAQEWLDMRFDSQSLYLYRHPNNQLLSAKHLSLPFNEKTLKEAEKSIGRAIGKGWVFFDDFFKGVHVPLDKEHPVVLTRTGRNWKYALPSYSEEQKSFFQAVIFEWLFEAGVVQVGQLDSRDCFRITALGHTLFAN